MSDKIKLRLALYWGAGCGGCDVSVVDLNEKVLDVAAVADFVFWPCATDFKYADVEAYEDNYIDVCFYTGAVRNSENEHIAKLLRRKSKVLVAYGTCAHIGGIPALANFFTREAILEAVYIKNISTENPDGVLPQEKTDVGGVTLELPEFYREVKRLNDVVDVDYYLPGCPPTVERIWEVIEAIVQGNLPPKGSVVGASETILCHTCSRKRGQKKIREFKRWQSMDRIEPDICLLEQGLTCLGPVTRAGCGNKCPSANAACRGCYGPVAEVEDQGAKMLTVLGSIIDSKDPAEIADILRKIADPSGTCFRFSAKKLKRASHDDARGKEVTRDEKN